VLPGVNPRLSLNDGRLRQGQQEAGCVAGGESPALIERPTTPTTPQPTPRVLPGVNPRLSLNERRHDLVRGDPHVLPGVNPRLSLNVSRGGTIDHSPQVLPGVNPRLSLNVAGIL